MQRRDIEEQWTISRSQTCGYHLTYLNVANAAVVLPSMEGVACSVSVEIHRILGSCRIHVKGR